MVPAVLRRTAPLDRVSVQVWGRCCPQHGLAGFGRPIRTGGRAGV
jgi:hypothetical protein